MPKASSLGRRADDAGRGQGGDGGIVEAEKIAQDFRVVLAEMGRWAGDREGRRGEREWNALGRLAVGRARVGEPDFTALGGGQEIIAVAHGNCAAVGVAHKPAAGGCDRRASPIRRQTAGQSFSR